MDLLHLEQGTLESAHCLLPARKSLLKGSGALETAGEVAPTRIFAHQVAKGPHPGELHA